MLNWFWLNLPMGFQALAQRVKLCYCMMLSNEILMRGVYFLGGAPFIKT